MQRTGIINNINEMKTFVGGTSGEELLNRRMELNDSMTLGLSSEKDSYSSLVDRGGQ